MLHHRIYQSGGARCSSSLFRHGFSLNNKLEKGSSSFLFINNMCVHHHHSNTLPNHQLNNSYRSFFSKKTNIDSDRIYIVPNKGTQVMSWGQNNEGQLGLNTFGIEKLSSPSFIDSYWFHEKTVKKISTAASAQHALALTEDGFVYAWGRGAEYQLAQDNNHSHAAPVLVDPKYFNLRPIVDIQCGGYHCAAIDDEGRLYTWGFSGSPFNQSALGHSGFNIFGYGLSPFPKQVEALKGEFVKQVACGDYHIGVICGPKDSNETSQVYVWGKGEWGRLGLGNSDSKALPTPLDMYEDDIENGGTKKTVFSKIRMGKNYSALIDSNGKLYMFGRHDAQQLGMESLRPSQFDCESTPKLIPRFVENDIKVRDVALGDSITACVTQDGRGFIWGKNVYLPHEVNFGKGVRVIECSAGRNHVAFLPINRRCVYTMGGNWYYQLGTTGQHGTQDVIKLTPQLVPGKKLQVACGNAFTLALIDLERKPAPTQEDEDDYMSAAMIGPDGKSIPL